MLQQKDTTNIDRSFGRINILFVSDFHQLESSDTSINNIPIAFIRGAKKYSPKANDEHGQYMFWGEGPGCIQGIAELTRCNRLEGSDEWPLEIQREFRETELTPDNHAFLHGQPTSKPGSWTNNKAMCGTKRCLDNLEAIAKYNSFECEIYQNE